MAAEGNCLPSNTRPHPPFPADLEAQASELHARIRRQSVELSEAIEAAKAREAEAQAQLKAAEAKLREAVQRDERCGGEACG